MLIYIDHPTYLRVYRANEGPIGPKRILVGRILKANYQFVGHKKAELASAEEEIDVQRVIQACRDAHQTRLRSEAMSFPEIARRVAEFYAAATDDVEKRLISAAVLQMSRALRKVDQAAPASQPAGVPDRR
jgi:hypothetical protein